MGFSVSAAMAGVAGAFYAQYISFVDSTTFTADHSFQILGMTILGGLGNISGSVLGAVSMTVLPEVLRGVAEYRQIIYGLILAFMVIVKPDGILGGFRLEQIRKLENAKGKKP
jgi:branched-chain amino acid transport system permease protein